MVGRPHRPARRPHPQPRFSRRLLVERLRPQRSCGPDLHVPRRPRDRRLRGRRCRRRSPHGAAKANQDKLRNRMTTITVDDLRFELRGSSQRRVGADHRRPRRRAASCSPRETATRRRLRTSFARSGSGSTRSSPRRMLRHPVAPRAVRQRRGLPVPRAQLPAPARGRPERSGEARGRPVQDASVCCGRGPRAHDPLVRGACRVVAG